MIVYKISNDVNDKVYVGITRQTLKQRWSQHKKAARKGNSRQLYCAMRKYGVDHFSIEILEEVDTQEELYEKEIYYVDKFNSYNKGYNMTEGGDINPMYCEQSLIKHNLHMRNDRVRKQISETMKDYYSRHVVSEQTRSKLSEYRKTMCFVHKGDKAIQVPKDELQQYLNDGWIKGSKPCDPEVVKRRSISRSRGVYCINEEYKVVADFNSIKSAAQWLYEFLDGKVATPHRLMTTIKRSSKYNKFNHGLKWIYK